MFRVCGVTYTFSANFGTCLQAYALQTAIESMEIQGEYPQYSLIPIAKSPGYRAAASGGLKVRVKRLIDRRTRKKFIGFENANIHYAPVKPVDEFDSYNNISDAFVCGSDVIWNPKYNHGFPAYYLDFAKKYAFSFAASFGQSDVDRDSLAKVGPLISRLREIGVREPQSADIARQCVNKKIEVVVDPVLLLDQREWERIAESENKSGRYIFVYTVNSSPLLRQFCAKLSKQTGLKVIVSGGNAGAVLKQKILHSFTPERWLQMIRDAEYVVTDSFHGTAFGTLFRKTVFTIVEGDPAAGFNMRMSGYLKGIALESRLVTAVPYEIDCTPIDYSVPEQLLEEKRRYSLDFLRRNLEAAYAEK